MNFHRFSCLVLAAASFTLIARAAENAPLSAGELASRLSALRQDGSSYVRLRMEINRAAKETFQIQIKQRRSKDASEVVYQVLWPKERKGESVLLRKAAGRAASGSAFVPPNTVRAISDPGEALLGSDLTCEDVVDDFFGWDRQTIAGTEDVDGVACQILESKPGKSDRSIYGSVKSWIDTRRMVPLRVEKYSGSGQIVRRIDTTRVVASGGKHIPANLVVRGTGGGSSTDLDGSRIRHDVNFADREFTVEGLKEVATPRGSAE